MTTSSGELSFTPKQSLHRPSEEFPPNIKDTKRCSAKRSRKGYHNIQFRIMPSNYFQEPLPHYIDDSFPSPKVRLQKHTTSYPNTSREDQSLNHGDPIPQTYALSKTRKRNST